MAVSFPSSFVQNCSTLFFPIAADFVTTAVFNRVTSQNKAQAAGFTAGMGALYFFGRQTSTEIGLTGAVLFLIYKVIVFLDHSLKQNINECRENLIASLQDAEKGLLEAQEIFISVSNEPLDFTDPAFNTQLTDLSKKLTLTNLVLEGLWKDQDFLKSIQIIMSNCRTVLLETHSVLKLEMWYQESNPEKVLQKMAAKFMNPDYKREKECFDSIFSSFNRIYRLIRCKGCVISLPNILNFPGRNFSRLVGSGTIDYQYNNFFITGTGLQHDLNTIFNDTQDQLADLLNLVYPDSPLNAKDEQPLPGDYGNARNPFRINTELL
jgi:hypothetical protein